MSVYDELQPAAASSPYADLLSPEDEKKKKAAAEKVAADAEAARPKPEPTPAENRASFGSKLLNFAGGIAEPIAAMATGAVAKPISDVVGMAAIPGHWAGLTKEDPMETARLLREGLTYSPRTEGGKSKTNPFNYIPEGIGQVWNQTLAEPVSNWAGGMVDDPDYAEMVRHGVKEAINQVPQVGGPVVGKIAKGTTPYIGARSVMQSALKPGAVARRTGQAESGITTLLGEDPNVPRGSNVSLGSEEKMTAKLDKFDDQLDSVIGNSTQTVPKRDVAAYAQKQFDRAKHTGTEAVDEVFKVWQDFMDTPAIANMTDIPVQTLQKVKREWSRQLSKDYGKLSDVETQARKSVVSGMAEKIGEVEPKAAEINAKMSPIINARNLVRERVGVAANRDLAGLAPIAPNAESMFAFLVDRMPLVKSMYARMLNQAGKVTTPTGIATTQDADRNAAERERKRLAELLKRNN